jgi:flavin reductase
LTLAVGCGTIRWKKETLMPDQLMPSPDSLTADFKAAMRRLTASVAILTTAQDGQRFGMAVTAVCSLGVSPPALIVSIAHTASMHDPVLATRRIAVNILRPDHREMVADFSGRKKGEARFEGGAWTAGPDGLPALVDAQATLFCGVAVVTPHNGHSVLFLDVGSVRLRDEIDPLLYQNGRVARAVYLDGAA